MKFSQPFVLTWRTPREISIGELNANFFCFLHSEASGLVSSQKLFIVRDLSLSWLSLVLLHLLTYFLSLRTVFVKALPVIFALPSARRTRTPLLTTNWELTSLEYKIWCRHHPVSGQNTRPRAGQRKETYALFIYAFRMCLCVCVFKGVFFSLLHFPWIGIYLPLQFKNKLCFINAQLAYI